MKACWILVDKVGNGYWHFWDFAGDVKVALQQVPDPQTNSVHPHPLTICPAAFQKTAKQLIATSRPHFVYDEDQQLWMPDLQEGDVLEVGVNQNGRPRWSGYTEIAGSDGGVVRGIVTLLDAFGLCWYKLPNTTGVIVLPNHPDFPGYGKPGWPHRIRKAGQEAAELPQEAVQTLPTPKYLAVVKQPPLDGYGPAARARTWDRQVDEVRRALQRTERFAPLCQSCDRPKTLTESGIPRIQIGIRWECREGCEK